MATASSQAKKAVVKENQFYSVRFPTRPVSDEKFETRVSAMSMKQAEDELKMVEDEISKFAGMSKTLKLHLGITKDKKDTTVEENKVSLKFVQFNITVEIKADAELTYANFCKTAMKELNDAIKASKQKKLKDTLYKEMMLKVGDVGIEANGRKPFLNIPIIKGLKKDDVLKATFNDDVIDHLTLPLMNDKTTNDDAIDLLTLTLKNDKTTTSSSESEDDQ